MNTDAALETVDLEEKVKLEGTRTSGVIKLDDGRIPSYTISSDKFFTWDPSKTTITTTSTTTTTGSPRSFYRPMTLDEIEENCNKYDLYIKESVGALERCTNDFVAGKITELEYLKIIEDVIIKRSTYRLALTMLQEIKKEG